MQTMLITLSLFLLSILRKWVERQQLGIQWLLIVKQFHVQLKQMLATRSVPRLTLDPRMTTIAEEGTTQTSRSAPPST